MSFNDPVFRNLLYCQKKFAHLSPAQCVAFQGDFCGDCALYGKDVERLSHSQHPFLNSNFPPERRMNGGKRAIHEQVFVDFWRQMGKVWVSEGMNPRRAQEWVRKQTQYSKVFRFLATPAGKFEPVRTDFRDIGELVRIVEGLVMAHNLRTEKPEQKIRFNFDSIHGLLELTLGLEARQKISFPSSLLLKTPAPFPLLGDWMIAGIETLTPKPRTRNEQ